MILNIFKRTKLNACVPRVGGGDPEPFTIALPILKCSPRRRG